MTRGAMETPAGRASARAAIRRRVAAALILTLAPALIPLARPAVALAADAPASPDGQILREVRIAGNVSVSEATIRDKAKLLSHANRPLNRATVDQDIRRLLDTKLFSDVTTGLTRPEGGGEGLVLTFHVVEMPVLTRVEFIGRSAIKLKDIEETTGLKKGARADTTRARLAVRQIRQLYEDKGYEKAEVELVKGGNPDDREVVFRIFEGPKFKVGSIDFIGNTFVEDAVLRTKLASRKPLFGLVAGHYQKDGFDEDARKLSEYYQSNGYLAVDIRPVVRTGDDLGRRDVQFVIVEGPRYRVRNIVFEGNKVLSTAILKGGLKLHSGQFFSDSVQAADRKVIETQYFSRGHIDARVQVEPDVTPQPDVVDLVYKIEEGDEYTIGEVIIRGNERTQNRVVRREADQAGVLPGERLDPSRLEKAKQRLIGTGYFNINPQMGPVVDLKIVNRRKANRPFGDTPMLDLGGVDLTRLQNPEDEPLPGGPPPIIDDGPVAAPGGGSPPLTPFGTGPSADRFRPETNTLPPIDAPVPPPTFEAPPRPRGPFSGRARGVAPGDPNVPGLRQSPGAAQALNDESNPTGSLPGFPNGNLNGNINDRGEPFVANKAYADVIASLSEGQTAKFQAGIGASSAGGLYGSVSVTENNFDLFAIPRSFDDIRQGRAFKGAGQQFSLELSPGTLINRYVVSFRDPYLFDLPIGLGVSGYQFSRFFTDWNEQRGGGRFSLGRQFGTSSYGEVAFRIEDVKITGFRYPAPALLLDVDGHTTLASLRPSFKVDNRDSPFLTNSGEYLELAYEQGFGTYNFGKLTAEARKFITTGSRPDGSGKRVLTLRGYFGVGSRETPIYERFFAGNLSSLRGFAYRGIGPYVLGVNTGGLLTTLGSVEYRFPWTANDQLQQVVFIDTGTVENDYRITDYRVAIGTGVRVLIPQIFKQVPLAFDLSFPLVKGPADREQLFNFSIGAQF